MEHEKIFQEAFDQIETLLEPKGVKSFLNLEYDDLNQCHFSPLGLWVRNHLLKSSGALYQLFHRAGIVQKDDMSDLVIRLFYIRLRLKHKPVTENGNVLHLPAADKFRL
jgi:hypothetical protein